MLLATPTTPSCQKSLEKWSVELFGSLLPRHLELIYRKSITASGAGEAAAYPNDEERLSPSIVDCRSA